MCAMRLAADVAPWSGRSRSSSRVGLVTVSLVFLAVLIMPVVIVASALKGWLAWDVRFAYLPAADAVLHGHSPYPTLDDPILEDQKGFVYPPQLVIALLPFARLPVDLVAAVVAIAMLAMVVLTLRTLGIRDLRCYAAALLWVPTVSGVLLSNVSIPLALAAAVVWRYRDAVWPPAVALGFAVSAKLLLWPLLVWTFTTRRIRTTLGAIVIGVVSTLGAWAAIGFDGLREYPDLLRRLSEIQSENSYSIVGMAATLGMPDSVGRSLTLLIGGGLVVGCVLLAGRGDEARSFACALASTLALSPIVWLHYLILLLVPLAILRPRFSPLWLLPVLLWVSPRPGYAEGVRTFAPALVAGILLAAMLARPKPEATPAHA